MRETFVLSGLGMKENRGEDSIISFTLRTDVGPGYLTLYEKLKPLNNRQVSVTINPIQASIDFETGEVAE